MGETAAASGPGGEPLPFVAPCRELPADAPLRWVRMGWADVRQAWRPTLSYGITVLAISYAVTWLAWRLGSYVLVLAALSGFVFVAPVVAIGLYEISRQVEAGQKPLMVVAIRGSRRAFGNAMVFALALLVVFLLWARAASVISIFFPIEADPELADLVPYLTIGSMVGAVFAGITFAASAFSLPMIDDRETDTVTALVTSINAVLRNKAAMAVWATIIVASVIIGFGTAFLGFVILIPLLGYATWHAYEETIDASAWPKAQ